MNTMASEPLIKASPTSVKKIAVAASTTAIMLCNPAVASASTTSYSNPSHSYARAADAPTRVKNREEIDNANENTISDSTTKVVVEPIGDVSFTDKESNMYDTTYPDLVSNQAFLEKSANWVGIIVIALIIGLFAVGLFLSWGLSLFFLPPIFAALGVWLSHGAQLNKADELLKQGN